MTTISAKLIASSISPDGVILDTFQLRYPKWFHGQLMAHRCFARNASSTRATPTMKLIESVQADPAMPFYWGRLQPGMQAKTRLTDMGEIKAAIALWKSPMTGALKAASELSSLLGVAKEVCGRLVEPWAHMDGIFSGTDWDNFFALRCHPDTEPANRVLAWKIADIRHVRVPTRLEYGEWHLPYISAEERASLDIETLKKCSAARCARVSYRTHDGKVPSVTKDLELHARLMAGLMMPEDNDEPGHLSPLEHQATPLEDPTRYSGPFRGWLQYRKTIPRENMRFDYEAAIKRGWRDVAFDGYQE